jgi:hypothetical protein
MHKAPRKGEWRTPARLKRQDQLASFAVESDVGMTR